MSLLVLEKAGLSFGKQDIFDDVSLRIDVGEKIGLIGSNGSGKSTLLRVLMGEQALDRGEMRQTKGTRVGYLPQDIQELSHESLIGSVLATVPGRQEVETALEQAQAALEKSTDPDEQMALATKLAEYGEELERFESLYSRYQALRILKGLGFKDTDTERPTNEFSGGWKMRAALAGLLFQQPDVLFLDEPTNHLDIPTVLWLDSFLREYRNALILICHDREFLNRHVKRVVSFEPEGLRTYKGNYEEYRKQRVLEEEILEAQARNQAKEMRDMERFVERFKAKASKARQAQSKAKQIKRLEAKLVKPIAKVRRLSFKFPDVARSGKDVVVIDNVSKAFGELVLYKNLSRTVHSGERIVIIGANGVGKTTLLRIIAHELKTDAGTVSYGANVTPGYYAQHHTDLLDKQRTVVEEVRLVRPDASESAVRGVCGAFLFSGDDVEKTIGVLSGGERARVLLARLLIKPGNLLLMDEPTNHLDVAAADALANALQDYGGTIVFVSHNTGFVNQIATKVWDVKDGGIVEYPGNLREYLEHVAARQERESQSTKKASKPQPKAKPSSHEDRKERKARKKREAAQRNQRHRGSHKLKKQVAEIEARVAKLETAQKELEPKLADPEIYKDKQTFNDVLSSFEENKAKLEELYARWEHKQKELEQAGD